MNDEPEKQDATEPTPTLDRDEAARRARRKFLAGAGVFIAGGIASKVVYDRIKVPRRANVFIAKAESYSADLEGAIRNGLSELGFGPAQIKGKRILLKPNLVEPSREAPHINTHPAVVRAAAEVFRRWDAASIVVAEGQGHCRDTILVLDESGMGPMLAEAELPFVDLNHDRLFHAENRLGLTKMAELVLPVSLQEADLVVSMPKLKTHHWAGVTLSMKNLFGVMPGVYYGWPKNVLHTCGIEQSILDIFATVAPQLAILDGIIGMEGDGPIMGAPKNAGLLVMGASLPAVDATATRLMGIDPFKIDYLQFCQGRLGPIDKSQIRQRGEPIEALAQKFSFLPHPLFDRFRSV